jgi:hypothetical protein
LGVLEDGALLSASRKCCVAVYEKLLSRSCHDERCDNGEETHGGWIYGCMDGLFVGRQSATCDENRMSAKRRSRAEEGTLTRQSQLSGCLVRAQKPIDEGKYSQADTAVAISAVAADKTMRLRNVP